MIANTNPKF